MGSPVGDPVFFISKKEMSKMIPNYNMYQAQQQIRLPYGDPNILKGRPVTSIDEVRAAPIDFDGSIFYFPDMTNNRIYTKQINMDGTAAFKVYELKAMPVEQTVPNMSNFITREEFEQAMIQLKALLPQSKPTETDIVSQF